MTRNKLLTACAIVSLTLGLSACSSDDGPATMMPGAQMEVDKVVPTGTEITLPAGLADDETFTAAEGEPVNIEDVGDFVCASVTCTVDIADNVLTVTGDIKVVSLADDLPDDVLAALTDAFKELVELTPLEAAKTAAADAATAAMTAVGTADEAVDAAEAARENAATMQTGGTSGGHAEMARTYATAAHTAYMAAKAASEDAAAAEDVTAAVEARVAAEVAMAEAVDAEAKATYHAGLAMDDANAELKIVGTLKTVGDTSIDAGAGGASNTDRDQTTITGLIKDLNPKTTVGDVTGFEFDLDTDPVAEGEQTRAHVQAVEERTFDIGKVVDSGDDKARLMIVTQYAGTKMAYVYTRPDTPMEDNIIKHTKPGVVSVMPIGDDLPVQDVVLKSEGTWYRAEGADDAMLVAADEVAAGTRGIEVFSYRDLAVVADDDDATKYVVSYGTVPSETGTTYRYIPVVALATLTAADPEMQKVRAAIPEAKDYAHIHFGVWAALGAAEKSGAQDLADLGIGFVQNWSDSGLTGTDMPNSAAATYKGDWVAAVRAAAVDGDGDISLTNGAATLIANFGMGKITATLTDLATLTGDIAGNTFSGTKATVIATNPHSLTATADFTGEFGGGFYGAKAAEAGGVFDFTSTGAKAGEFRGAFGADKK